MRELSIKPEYADEEPFCPATKRQTWAIFCLTGYDVRGCRLSKSEASGIISDLKEGLEVEFQKLELRGALKKGKGSKKKDWQALYDKADNAGKEAAEKIKFAQESF